MTNPLSWFRDDETLFILGKLKGDLLNPLWNVRYQVMQGVRKIDLYSVTYVDTVGISLLVHLVNIGEKQRVHVILTSSANSNVFSLAKIYNLPEDLFPINSKSVYNVLSLK